MFFLNLLCMGLRGGKRMKVKLLTVVTTLLMLVVLSYNIQAAEISLDEAIQTALAQNKSLENSWRDVEKASKDLEIVGRSYYPSLDVQTSYTHLGEAPSVPTGQYEVSESLLPSSTKIINGDKITFNNRFLIPKTVEGESGSYSTTLSLNQPLYLGGTVALREKMTTLSHELSLLNYQQKKEEVIFNVIQSYYGVLMAQGMIDIRENALEVVEEHLRIVNANFEAGVSLKQDLLQTTIEKRRAEQELTAARNQLNLARKRLAQLLQLDQLSFAVNAPHNTPQIVMDSKILVEQAYQNRIELKSLALNRSLLKVNQKLAGNPYRPQVALNGSYNWQGQEFMEGGSWRMTIGASMPLYEGGKASLQDDKYQLDLEKLAASRSNLKEAMEIELNSIVLSLEESAEKIELETLSVANAEENLELASKSYRAGMGSNLDVINAQIRLRQAQIGKLQAEYQHEQDLFKAKYKTGKLLTYFKDVIKVVQK